MSLRAQPKWSWLPAAATIQRFSTIAPHKEIADGWQFEGAMTLKEFTLREMEREGIGRHAVCKRIKRGKYTGLKLSDEPHQWAKKVWIEK